MGATLERLFLEAIHGQRGVPGVGYNGRAVWSDRCNLGASMTAGVVSPLSFVLIIRLVADSKALVIITQQEYRQTHQM